MDIIESFAHDVRDIEHTMIPARDGTRLAARLWLPATASQRPVPAILEYIPYRKRDGTRMRDEPMHRWFAGNGYAAVRVDLRGSGESEGTLTDEYTELEQQDAVDVIAWIARQPWCDGRVAMLGKSWGGFGALQVAALQPPALRAVIAVCASDDRYADDAHFMGGCLLNENLLWGSMLMALCAQPPSPAHHGDRWRELWRARLAAIEPFPAVWLRHPLRDDYWRRGSICEHFDRVRVPVFAVSGWADGYSNAVLRLLAGLSGERFGWIGPWGHAYPHEGVPGPAVGFLQEARSFLDRFCRGDDAAFAGRPRLRAWLQDSARPAASPELRPGRWVAETEWPSPRIQPLTLHLDGDRLASSAAHEPGRRRVATPQHVGADAGAWCAFGLEGEHPGDQRHDDALSSCSETAPLTAPLAMLGAARLRLRLTSDRPVAQLCARLCEVFPDGASARVTFGLLDLTHRHGHDRAVAVPVGVPFEVELALNDAGHVFAAGNRVRLALSTSYWPMAWPAPRAAALLVHDHGSVLELPVRPDHAADALLPPLPPPESAAPPPHRDLDPGGVRRRSFQDPRTDEHVQETVLDLDEAGRPACVHYEDIDQASGHGIRETFRIRADDPSAATAEVLHRTVMRAAGHDARVELSTSLRADAQAFLFCAELAAFDRDDQVFHRRWRETIARPPGGIDAG